MKNRQDGFDPCNMTMIQGRVVSEVNTCDAMKIIYCKILKVLQHFLQYFESFAIIFAIL